MNKREMTGATKELVMQASRPIRCPRGGATMLRKIRETDITIEKERQMIKTLSQLKREGICRPRYDGAGQPSSGRLIMVEPLV